jgi:hypothetical protein
VVELDATVAELNDLILEVSETTGSLSMKYYFGHGTRLGPLSPCVRDLATFVSSPRARGLIHCGKKNWHLLVAEDRIPLH